MKNRHRVSQVVSKLTCSRAAGARCEADEVLGPMILPSCGGLKPMTDVARYGALSSGTTRLVAFHFLLNADVVA
jgi:hypothetical protein